MVKRTNGGKTALAVIGDQEYAVLKVDAANLPLILEENLGPDGLRSLDLERVKIPAGGGISWEIPQLDGVVSAKTIEAVIVYHKRARAYWAEKFEGAGTPPECSSDDAIIGTGLPGGDCAKCPLSAFGSSDNNKGQACKEIKQLFCMTPNELLPIVISLPPTSISNARKFMLRLASHSLPFYGVSVIFGLEKTKNSTGIEYSRVTLTMGNRLSLDQAAKFKTLSETLRPHLDHVPLNADDCATNED